MLEIATTVSEPVQRVCCSSSRLCWHGDGIADSLSLSPVWLQALDTTSIDELLKAFGAHTRSHACGSHDLLASSVVHLRPLRFLSSAQSKEFFLKKEENRQGKVFFEPFSPCRSLEIEKSKGGSGD